MKSFVISVYVDFEEDILDKLICAKEEYVDEFKNAAIDMIKMGHFDYDDITE